MTNENKPQVSSDMPDVIYCREVGKYPHGEVIFHAQASNGVLYDHTKYVRAQSTTDTGDTPTVTGEMMLAFTSAFAHWDDLKGDKPPRSGFVLKHVIETCKGQCWQFSMRTPHTDQSDDVRELVQALNGMLEAYSAEVDHFGGPKYNAVHKAAVVIDRLERQAKHTQKDKAI